MLHTSSARVAGLQVHSERRRTRSEGVQVWVGHADVARRAPGADSVHVAEDVGRAAETGRVELLQRRQVRVGRDAATDSHPAERRRLHDDHVVALTTARAERLHVAVLAQLLSCNIRRPGYTRPSPCRNRGKGNAIGRVRPFVFTLAFEPPDL